MSGNLCSCMIPFYNEGQRVLDVLRVVETVREVAQIICVDDGSSDGIWRNIRQSHGQVTLVQLSQNRGKAAAVAEGLAFVENPYVLLLDADLQGLDAGQIGAAIVQMVNQPHIDMIILRRIRAGLHAKISRGDVLFAGERILRTADLVAALESCPQGYQLEMAINRYMMQHRKEVVWAPSLARNTYKMDKVGLISGLIQEFKMVAQMISFDGLAAYVRQFCSFAWRRQPVLLPRRAESLRRLFRSHKGAR